MKTWLKWTNIRSRCVGNVIKMNVREKIKKEKKRSDKFQQSFYVPCSCYFVEN